MPSKFWFLLLSLACSVLASLLFIPGLSGAFLFDDGPNIVDNASLHLTHLDLESLRKAAYSFQPGGGSRALPMLSFALDHWRAGPDPAAFKTTNLVIHTITTVAIAFFLRGVLLLLAWPPRQATLAALALALAWAIHPLQVSSVLYVVQRMQTMATLFIVLSLLTYIGARRAQLEGRPSRPSWILTFLFGALAFASKEDSIVLPAYMLALELTVLRFGAAQPSTAKALKRGYLALTALGALLYLLVVLPHFWVSGAYSGRDYGSLERLLTQARVLAMYWGQIVFPLPQQLPFYYDWIVSSRGLLQPRTTLPALMLIGGLLALAGYARVRRPLLSLGILFFFIGHFISSNVLGLELAFEHRNHFPLIGAVLVLGDLVALGMERAKLRPWVITAACVVPAIWAAGTLSRAILWGNPMEFARKSTEFAPGSSRAWNSLCIANYNLSGEKPGPYLDQAIAACEKGGDIPYATTSLTNLVVFKTIRGDAVPDDWRKLHDRLRSAIMSSENSRTAWVLMTNAHQGVALDEAGMLEAIDIVMARLPMQPMEYAAIGYFIMDSTAQPARAYPAFARVVESSPPDSVLVAELLRDLKAKGRPEWAVKLQMLADQRRRDTLPAPAQD